MIKHFNILLNMCSSITELFPKIYELNIVQYLYVLNMFYICVNSCLVFFVLPSGDKFINKLLTEFLFPASKLILESTTNNVKLDPQADYNPK